MNASIPPDAGSIMDVLSLLKDDKKAQDFLSKSEKTKSEIAQGLRENEKKIEELKGLELSVKQEHERLSLMKKRCDESVAKAQAIDKEIEQNKLKSQELLASAEKIKNEAIASADLLIANVKAGELEIKDMREETLKAFQDAKALKASYLDKITKLKQIISEA